MNNVSSSNSQKALVPELRFPEFTDTWKTDLIGNIGSFTKGAGLSKADITENGTPFILYGELYTTYGDVIYDIKRKTNKAVSEECYSKVGDVIIPTSGETPEEIATSACVMIPDVILAGDLNILRSSNIDGRFLSYLINHVANKSIAKIAQGKSVVHIQAKEISKIAINFPSSAEQLRIVNLLELLDAKISKQEDLIKGLKLYKRGLINQIFDNKLSLSKNSEWHKYQLSDILKERKTYCEKDGTYEHATLSKEGVYEKTNRYDRDYLVSSDDKKYKITKLGDICYNPANLKFGVICLNTYGDAIFSPIYITFEVNKNFNKEFIGFCLTRNDFINEALQYQQGTVYERMAVSPEDLLSMSINLPPKDIQDSLAKVFLKIEDMVSKTEMTLTELKQMRIALLQKMFI